jgi:propanediol dehydratase small subunit
VAELSYPLAADAAAVRTATGRPASELTVQRVLDGAVQAQDIRIAPETLRLQAGFAERGGNPQLAENMRRGAELCAFGDDELLAFYEALRPGRSSASELAALAAALEARSAVLCAALVREARAAYVRRGLARPE